MKTRRLVCAMLLLTAIAAIAQDDRSFETDKHMFVVRYESELLPLAINRIHRWVVHVETAGGELVEDAEVTLVGGMPDHDHGMPTVPRTTRYLGDGDYLVEGMKFHMNGRWLITITIAAGDDSDSVTFELQL